MAFKMKRSPAKNLGDFFGSIFSGKAVKGRQDAQRKRNTGEYEGMTDFEKRRAEKKSRKAGESKFQADVRRKREKKAEAKKTEAKKAEVKPEVKPEVKEEVKEEVKQVKAEKATIPWDKAPKVGTQARTDWYKKFNLKLDETTPIKNKKNMRKPFKMKAGKAGPMKKNYGIGYRKVTKSPKKDGIKETQKNTEYFIKSGISDKEIKTDSTTFNRSLYSRFKPSNKRK